MNAKQSYSTTRRKALIADLPITGYDLIDLGLTPAYGFQHALIAAFDHAVDGASREECLLLAINVFFEEAAKPRMSRREWRRLERERNARRKAFYDAHPEYGYSPQMLETWLPWNSMAVTPDVLTIDFAADGSLILRSSTDTADRDAPTCGGSKEFVEFANSFEDSLSPFKMVKMSDQVAP